MSRAVRIALFVIVPLVLIVVVPVAVYGIDRAMNSGDVPRNVSVSGVDIGGASPEEARRLLEAYEQQLQQTPATFTVESSSFDLDPTTVALRADVDGAVDEALAQRNHGFLDGFFPWVQSFGDDIELELAWSLDEEAVDEHLDTWERQAITEPPYDGDVAVVDGVVTYEYPAVGMGIDRTAAHAVVAEQLKSPERSTVGLALRVSEPTLTVDDIDGAVGTLNRMLSRPVVLSDVSRGVSFVLTREQLAEAIEVEIARHSDASIELGLSEEVVAGYLEARRDELDVPPIDATFDVDITTDTVSIIPSRHGLTVDPAAATAALFEAAKIGLAGQLPYTAGVAPDYSTEDAEAFGPLGLVSEFTTNTPGVNRVFNIHLMADTIDGQVVWPGEEFSINDFVGQRTEAKGYKRDGAIIKGEVTCCDSPANVGGGVSQYSTTFYNAIFFGCYEDLDHTPHSLYISRYPEGREATMGFPAPDVRFRNDTDAPVIIRNTYDGNRNITVKFYGNNGGRECTAERSGRFGHTSARVVYEPNAAVDPGTEKIVKRGSGGFSVTVTRVMTMPDGTVIRQPYTHHYRGLVRKIEKHPCDLPGGGECPILVPGVVGLMEGDASAALTGADFGVTVTYVVDDANVGIVISQSHSGYWPAGTPITITVGEASETAPPHTNWQLTTGIWQLGRW
jgi:vancomycin resistance protein YoaR